MDGAGDPVYIYDQDEESNATGYIYLAGLEWDTYNITVDPVTNWGINETDPPQPIILMPQDDLTVTLTLEPMAVDSLITVIVDIDDAPVAGASVTVTNVLGYDEEILTGSAGQAFFTPLANVTTTVEVIKAGFEDYLNEFIVNGYTTEPVIMVVP